MKVRRMVEGQETSLQKENAKIITKAKTGSSKFPESGASIDFESKICEAGVEVLEFKLGTDGGRGILAFIMASNARRSKLCCRFDPDSGAERPNQPC